MKREKFAYTLLAPMIIIMLVLVIYPIAATFSYSLKKWKLSKPNDIRFIGFKNYINILSSESFLQSVKNTLFILVAVVIITTIISILVALFLNIKVRFCDSYSTLGYSAFCQCSFVEVCILFRLRLFK